MMSKENTDYLMQAALGAGIKEPAELANFMAQMEVESGHFSSMNENLHYSGARLLKLFDGRNGLSSIEQANAIAAAGPEKIAEAIYGGEWGSKKLGNVQEGDGWRYHGRGFVQLTGRDSYQSATDGLRAKGLDLDLVNHPELAGDREVAAQVAIWYWESQVRSLHHQHDVVGASHDINGGKNGLPERMAAAASWESKLTHGDQPGTVVVASSDLREISMASAASPETPHAMTLHEGVRGAAVTELQTQLNAGGYAGANGNALHPDGRFGTDTRYAVEAFQRDHGLAPDGVAGRETMNALHASDLQHGKAQPSHALVAAQLNDPAHPDHAIFTQAQSGVHQLDAQHGRAPDLRSDNLAASLVVAARGDGMQRIDHVALGTDATKVFAVQGALNSPFKQITSVPTVEALNTPVARSTQAWNRLMDPQTTQAPERQAQPQTQQQPTHEEARPPLPHSR